MYDEMKQWINDGVHDPELYSKVLEALESFRFTAPNCPIDANLIAYAQDLWIKHKVPLKQFGESTVLEALVGIATRHVDFRVYTENDDEARVLSAMIFWEMLENMELTMYTNDVLMNAKDDPEILISDCYMRDINTTINRFLNRDFDEKGFYSPFYLGNSDEKELPKAWFTACYWMQMDWWWEKFAEKFDKKWRYMTNPSLKSMKKLEEIG